MFRVCGFGFVVHLEASKHYRIRQQRLPCFLGGTREMITGQMAMGPVGFIFPAANRESVVKKTSKSCSRLRAWASFALCSLGFSNHQLTVNCADPKFL